MAKVVFSDINTRIIKPKEDRFLTTDADLQQLKEKYLILEFMGVI